ncbi:MAG: PRC-barrel domain-containing protein [Proteobacteria bacterium]|nr:PRC-barrel domain-containing protein [Pseudomonadota bacterium]
MRKTLPAAAAILFLASTAAFAQTTAPTTTTPHATTPAPSATKPSTSTSLPGGTLASMTDAEAKAWVGKNIYSSDNKHIGDVAAIKRDSTGKVTEIEADVGGFLGLGTSRVKLNPSQVTVAGDRMNTNMTSDQVKNLPKVTK